MSRTWRESVIKSKTCAFPEEHCCCRCLRLPLLLLHADFVILPAPNPLYPPNSERVTFRGTALRGATHMPAESQKKGGADWRTGSVSAYLLAKEEAAAATFAAWLKSECICMCQNLSHRCTDAHLLHGLVPSRPLLLSLKSQSMHALFCAIFGLGQTPKKPRHSPQHSAHTTQQSTYLVVPACHTSALPPNCPLSSFSNTSILAFACLDYPIINILAT